MDYDFITRKFTEIYGQTPRLFRAPGRVNLIGEHTDYNDGFVLPMAIDRETVIAAFPRQDNKIQTYTINLNQSAECKLDEPFKQNNISWFSYIEGVARILQRNGVKIFGANLLVFSDVPTGAGLSSSAALEVATGFSLCAMFGQTVDKTMLALVGQKAEHEFIGAKVGIMDQFVSAHAAQNCALFLDCRTLEFEHIPLDGQDFAVVICDSHVKHEIANSGYNERRLECAEAVKLLQEFLPKIENLRDVTIEVFGNHADELPEIIQRRAKHIITENERVKNAVSSLKTNDLANFGKLMNESHLSMRDDYEISCQEVDWLVEIAQNIEGVLGARMTGGGFGGSSVNLVKRQNLAHFCDTIKAEYFSKTRIETTVLITAACPGASEIKP